MVYHFLADMVSARRGFLTQNRRESYLFFRHDFRCIPGPWDFHPVSGSFIFTQKGFQL